MLAAGVKPYHRLSCVWSSLAWVSWPPLACRTFSCLVSSALCDCWSANNLSASLMLTCKKMIDSMPVHCRTKDGKIVISINNSRKQTQILNRSKAIVLPLSLKWPSRFVFMLRLLYLYMFVAYTKVPDFPAVPSFWEQGSSTSIDTGLLFPPPKID